MPGQRAKEHAAEKRSLVFGGVGLRLLALAGFAQPSRGKVIYVTTLNDTIGDASGCSLKDAIFASTFHINFARTGYDDAGTPQYVTTQCVPGDGNDTIVLPNGSLLQLYRVLDDADNSTGQTATPVVATNITIEANGATLQGVRCIGCTPAKAYNFRAFTVGSAGHLTIRNAHLKGFSYRGGDGAFGGGGGMGAGGAIYVQGGALTVENTTFDGNVVTGGDGGGKGYSDSDSGGGGGGLGGSGGSDAGAVIGLTVGASCGGGGGGARSDGLEGDDPEREGTSGGGGGGTVRSLDSAVNNQQPGASPAVAKAGMRAASSAWEAPGLTRHVPGVGAAVVELVSRWQTYSPAMTGGVATTAVGVAADRPMVEMGATADSVAAVVRAGLVYWVALTAATEVSEVAEEERQTGAL